MIDLQTNSLVALRDLEGLVVVSDLPYFFLPDAVVFPLALSDILALASFKVFVTDGCCVRITTGAGACLSGFSMYLRSTDF